jgi:hypothetical protein
LDIELHPTPINKSSNASVSIQGDMTLSTVTFDTAVYLIRTAFNLSPTGTSCVIPEEQILLTGIRVVNILTTTTELALRGDFRGAYQEFMQIANQFYDQAGEVMAEIGLDCATDILKSVAEKPAMIIRIGVDYLTWIPVVLFDYFKYQGLPAQVQLVYTSSQHTQPAPIIFFQPPTSTPTEAPTPTLTEAPILIDVQLLQACLEQEYFCMPIPFEITGNVDWVAGLSSDPSWWGGDGPKSYYLGFNIEPGTIITSPFDGEVHQAEDWSKDVILTISLPNGDSINLTFSFNRFDKAHAYKLLAPNGSQVLTGDPLIHYIGEIDRTGIISDCCELPGILEIYAGDYPNQIPIYPVLAGGESDINTMMTQDCRGCPYEVMEGIPIKSYYLVTYEVQTDPPSNYFERVKRFILKMLE